jgi:hypothetical protein
VRIVKASVDLTGATGVLLEHARYVVDRIRLDPTFRFARIRDGELQIRADTVDDALHLDSYFGSGDEHHRAIPVRYVVKGGTDFGKVATGRRPRRCRPSGDTDSRLSGRGVSGRSPLTLTPGGPDWREVRVVGNVSEAERREIMAGWTEGAA